jgi:hypothetical protein
MAQTDIISEVIEAVAEADGMEPTELDMLHEYIDPSILRKLAEQERAEWSLTFQYSDHQVTVTDQSQILVDGVPYSPEASME